MMGSERGFHLGFFVYREGYTKTMSVRGVIRIIVDEILSGRVTYRVFSGRRFDGSLKYFCNLRVRGKVWIS